MCCHLVDCGFAFQVVMFDHVFREVRNLEPHVFLPFHGGIEVEIIDVDRHVVGVLGGYGAVLMHIEGDQGNSGHAAIYGIYDAVSPDCQACPVRVVLCWSVSHHDAPIRDISSAVGWDAFLVGEENCTGAFNSFRHSVSKAPDFVSV